MQEDMRCSTGEGLAFGLAFEISPFEDDEYHLRNASLAICNGGWANVTETVTTYREQAQSQEHRATQWAGPTPASPGWSL